MKDKSFFNRGRGVIPTFNGDTKAEKPLYFTEINQTIYELKDLRQFPR